MIENLANIEFYKTIYDNEINRKNEINGLVKFPTTLLSVLIGVSFYLFKPVYANLGNIDRNYLLLSIVILSILFAISITVSVFFLVKMFHNLFKKYHYLPSPKELKNRQIFLYNYGKNFYTETKQNDIENMSIKYSKEEFNKDLINYYIDNATLNQKVNDTRYEDYYRSRHFLMASLIIITISGILILIKL